MHEQNEVVLIAIMTSTLCTQHEISRNLFFKATLSNRSIQLIKKARALFVVVIRMMIHIIFAVYANVLSLFINQRFIFLILWQINDYICHCLCMHIVYTVSALFSFPPTCFVIRTCRAFTHTIQFISCMNNFLPSRQKNIKRNFSYCCCHIPTTLSISSIIHILLSIVV